MQRRDRHRIAVNGRDTLATTAKRRWSTFERTAKRRLSTFERTDNCSSSQVSTVLPEASVTKTEALPPKHHEVTKA